MKMTHKQFEGLVKRLFKKAFWFSLEDDTPGLNNREVIRVVKEHSPASADTVLHVSRGQYRRYCLRSLLTELYVLGYITDSVVELNRN